MTYALHSLSVYKEIIAHTNLNMMTKLTDSSVGNSSHNYFVANERSDAFREAWVGATEANILVRKGTKLISSNSEY